MDIYSQELKPRKPLSMPGCPIPRVLCEKVCPERSRSVGFSPTPYQPSTSALLNFLLSPTPIVDPNQSRLFCSVSIRSGSWYRVRGSSTRCCGRETSSTLDLAVARFPLSSELSSLHDDVIQYSSDIHASFDEKSPLSTYALANIT